MHHLKFNAVRVCVKLHNSVCESVCNPRAQVALLNRAKWRFQLVFDKWPLNAKATFTKFGDGVEGQAHEVNEDCWCSYINAGGKECALPQH